MDRSFDLLLRPNDLFSGQGHHGDAEALFERVLARQEEALGLDHPDVAVSLNSHAGALQAQVKTSEFLLKLSHGMLSFYDKRIIYRLLS